MTEIIAIDGPASVGKSTLVAKVAKKLKCPYLSSGKLYRLTAYRIIGEKIDINNKQEILKCINHINISDLSNENLFTAKIDRLSSLISSRQYIRDRLKLFQKDFPRRYAKGKKFALIEGRDISTEIFPNAKYNIFMWAESTIRAERRYSQKIKNGQKASINRIQREIIARDYKDLNRRIAPLKPDVNSVLLDTTYLDIEQSLNVIMNIINK